MTGSQAIILGLVQGVTEFLPISSSAHVILTSFFLGWQDQGLFFDIAVHLGSMVAIVLFLRRDLAEAARSFFRRDAGDGDFQPPPGLGPALALGTAPVAIFGWFAQDFVETTGREPVLIATTSILYGILLLLADRMGAKSRRLGQMNLRDGLLIGLGQALSLVPGTSRAGITMTVALALGYDRASAARFSFLLAVPVSLLVAIRQLLFLDSLGTQGLVLGDFVAGFMASGIAAYLAVTFLIKWVKRQDYSLFVAYRVLLGLVILVSVWS